MNAAQQKALRWVLTEIALVFLPPEVTRSDELWNEVHPFDQEFMQALMSWDGEDPLHGKVVAEKGKAMIAAFRAWE